MDDEEVVELNFSLLHDKGLFAQVQLAVWNPERDLLALVTSERQLVVHRLNWQRLWAVTPEVKVTALCWRPDGRTIALGNEDGSIALHNAENGELLRRTERHHSAITCLTWVEEKPELMPKADFSYEDRTARFFPAPPRPPPGSSVASVFDTCGKGDARAGGATHGSRGGGGGSHPSLASLSLLCSGDRDGVVCLSAFGVFPVAGLVTRRLRLDADSGRFLPQSAPPVVHRSLRKNLFDGAPMESEREERLEEGEAAGATLSDSSIVKLAMSRDFRCLSIAVAGLPSRTTDSESDEQESGKAGLFSISVDSSIFTTRRREIGQVALQASCVMELLDIAQATLASMEKQWAEAINSFNEKKRILQAIIRDHGSRTTPKDELLSLVTSGSASPALQQYLGTIMSEQGLKRLAKNIDSAGTSLHSLMMEHLQPAMELIVFRLGELHGLSRWHSRMRQVGLSEDLLESLVEYAGMALVQLERMIRLTASTSAQFRTFFIWVLRCVKLLDEDTRASVEQLPPFNIVAVAEFLQTTFERDAVGPQLAPPKDGRSLDLTPDENVIMDQLAMMGGFSDSRFLSHTLRHQIHILHQRCEYFFSQPREALSPQLHPRALLRLRSLTDLAAPMPSLAIHHYESSNAEKPGPPTISQYTCWDAASAIPSLQDASRLCILRQRGALPTGPIPAPRELATIPVQQGFRVIDFAFYKDQHLALLVSERAPAGARCWLTLIPCTGLMWRPAGQSALEEWWGGTTGVDMDKHEEVHEDVLGPESGRSRELAQRNAVAPLAISMGRGLACAFGGQRRIMLYDLEDTDELKADDSQH